MLIYYYDKTFEGLLTAIFDAFKLKQHVDQLLVEGDVEPLFVDKVHHVITDNRKYERVQIALKKRLSRFSLRQLMAVWFSELPESDLLIFRYLHKLFKTQNAIETDFADPDILAIRKIANKVSRECENLRQFVRFNLIKNPDTDSKAEKIYFAVIDPIYNALPLTIDFFYDRFADQKWAIYDQKRQFGYFYDLNKLEIISLNDDLLVNQKINDAYLDEDEKLFQKMWFRYCKALTIKERINPKLQRQYMPRRFWHHLPEIVGDKP
ncbi:TIGR03915 family putative DNA repair protein [Orbaceae bacterium ESL0721]|nr:TIGR03915 family putative DNA repair protein [Orbaceae bacterium ESL0721]